MIQFNRLAGMSGIAEYHARYTAVVGMMSKSDYYHCAVRYRSRRGPRISLAMNFSFLRLVFASVMSNLLSFPLSQSAVSPSRVFLRSHCREAPGAEG